MERPRLLAAQSADAVGSTVIDSAERILNGVLAALPRLGVSVLIIASAFLASAVLTRVLRGPLRRHRNEDFARVMTKLLRWAVLTLGALFAITALFPSVKPVDLLAGLGIMSIAIGFAFQDILSNLLSGILMLFRQPFEPGDQIEVDGHTGTVERITIRETEIKTFDGERILIPNQDVYTNAIRVQTAFGSRRTRLMVGVGYDADLEHAQQTAVQALAQVAGVMDEPEPEAYPMAFGGSSIDIELRYWTKPDQASHRKVLADAVIAVKKAYDREGIDIPFPIRTLDVRPSFENALRGASAEPGSSSNGTTTRGRTPS